MRVTARDWDEEIIPTLANLWPNLELNADTEPVWQEVCARHTKAHIITSLRAWKAKTTTYPQPASLGKYLRERDHTGREEARRSAMLQAQGGGLDQAAELARLREEWGSLMTRWAALHRATDQATRATLGRTFLRSRRGDAARGSSSVLPAEVHYIHRVLERHGDLPLTSRYAAVLILDWLDHGGGRAVLSACDLRGIVAKAKAPAPAAPAAAAATGRKAVSTA